MESSPTIAGVAADHRLPLPASQVEAFARLLAIELGLPVAPPTESGEATLFAGWIGPLARDLQAHAGTSLVVAGDHQPPVVHAVAHAINNTLGNAGQTVVYTAPVVSNPAPQRVATRSTPPRRISTLLRRSTRFPCAPIWAFMPTKPLPVASGMYRNPIIWRLGGMAAPTTAR